MCKLGLLSAVVRDRLGEVFEKFVLEEGLNSITKCADDAAKVSCFKPQALLTLKRDDKL